MKGLAVFHNGGAGIFAKFLKPGFKHCFSASQIDGQWIVFEGGPGRRPDLQAPAGMEYNLAKFYRDQGFMVLEVEREQPPTVWPFMMANCMGATKKMLGVNSWWIQTPWQLFKHLKKEQDNAVHP